MSLDDRIRATLGQSVEGFEPEPDTDLERARQRGRRRRRTRRLVAVTGCLVLVGAVSIAGAQLWMSKTDKVETITTTDPEETAEFLGDPPPTTEPAPVVEETGVEQNEVDLWTSTSVAPITDRRQGVVTVWTGQEVLIWK